MILEGVEQLMTIIKFEKKNLNILKLELEKN